MEASTGAVVVLAGRGGRPPDGDHVGTWNWQRYLKKADEFSKGNYEGKMEAVAQLFGATNYKDREPPWNPFIYSFDLFDIEECRSEVRAALDSKTSLAYAMKKFIMPFGEDNLGKLLQENEVSGRLGINLQDMKKGNAVVQTPTGSGGQFMEEGINVTRRDNPANTACARCGSPHGLKACGRCGQRFYCSKVCQTVGLVFFSSFPDAQVSIGSLEREAQERLQEPPHSKQALIWIMCVVITKLSVPALSFRSS